MARRISFWLTKRQFLDGTKTVTRRMGWEHLRGGEELVAIEKGQGMKAGDAQIVLGRIRVRSARRESLDRMTIDEDYGQRECEREGFPEMTPEQFVEFFCKSHTGCYPSRRITRIEFERLAP